MRPHSATLIAAFYFVEVKSQQGSVHVDPFRSTRMDTEIHPFHGFKQAVKAVKGDEETKHSTFDDCT